MPDASYTCVIQVSRLRDTGLVMSLMRGTWQPNSPLPIWIATSLLRAQITDRCPETSVRNYHHSLRNNTEERSSHVLRGGSLKPGIILVISVFPVLFVIGQCMVSFSAEFTLNKSAVFSMSFESLKEISVKTADF
jgi:hypothetical protein